MLRRIIFILTLVLICAAVTSLAAFGATFLAGGLSDQGAAAIFRLIANLFASFSSRGTPSMWMVPESISVVDLCLLVLAMAVCLVEQSNNNHAVDERDRV